jgi:hypothetical protein
MECGEVFTGFGWEAQWEEITGKTKVLVENNIKMDLREVRINGANWIWLAKGRVQWQAFVNMVMKLWSPYRKQAILRQAE